MNCAATQTESFKIEEFLFSTQILFFPVETILRISQTWIQSDEKRKLSESSNKLV